MEEDLLTFSSIADAMSQGRNTVKSTFAVEAGVEGNEDARNYEIIFNANWAAKAKPLSNKMAAFFAAVYKLMPLPGIVR